MPVLNGVTRNSAGSPLAGVSVKVFRSDTDALVATGTSGVDGSYSIVTPGTGPYYAVAYKAGSPDIAGTTVNTLMAEALYVAGAAVAAGLAVALAGGALLKAGIGGSAGVAAPAAVGSAQTGAVMPSGAMGIWYAKDYDATNKVVPNAVNASSPIYPAISRYNGPELYLSGGSGDQSDITYNATKSSVSTTGPTGVTENVTRVSSAGDYYLGLGPSRVPTGQTHRISFDYKSNTGSTQTTNFANLDNLGGGTILSVTTSWQRGSATFTAGQAPMLISPDRATGIDMLLANMNITLGTVDPGREVKAGHAYFDPINQNLVTYPATGVLDLSGGGSALIRFPTDTNLAAGFTCGAMVKRVSSGGSGYQSTLSQVESYSGFTAYMGLSDHPQGSLGGASAAAFSAVWDRNGAGWHLITHRYDPVSGYYDIFLDDARIVHQTVTPSAANVRNLYFGTLNQLAQFTNSHQVNSWFLYPTALTLSQIQGALYSACKSRLTTDGQTHTRSRIICAEGDSITEGNSYYVLSAASLTGQGVDYAVSGSTIVNLNSRWNAGIKDLIPAGSTGTYIMSALIGANDLAGYTGASSAAASANWLTALFAYTDMIRAAGWKVVLCTVLPRDPSTVPEHNIRRAIVNPQIRSSVGTHCDGVCDFDTDAQMGIDTSYSTYPANWTDGTHPNSTGHARLAPIYTAAMNAIT